MPRLRFQNNAPLVLAATVGVAGLFLLASVLLRKSRDFAPDFVASVLLYGLTVLNLTLLLILLFVLGRNLIRALMERQRGVLGARFRLRLALVFLLVALAPCLLLVVVGSDIIQQTVDRWFNVDVERMLSSSQSLGTALRSSVSDRSRIHARALAREIEARGLLSASGKGRLRRTIETRARDLELDMVSVFVAGGEILAVADPRLPAIVPDAAASEALAEAALEGREAFATAAFGGGELLRASAPVRDEKGGALGAVVVSTFLAPTVAADAREVQERYTKFQKALEFREPIKAVYLSLFLFPALLVLFGAVWLSLYLAGRITKPVRLVAEGAERIAAGERGVRVDFPSGNDEFTALIASFNRMSERLARSEEEVEHNRADLVRKNQELDERRRLMETVLETVGTGVLVVDHEGTATAMNAAACRLLDLRAEAVVGRSVRDVLVGAGLHDVLELLDRLLSGRSSRQEREVRVASAGSERHLALTVVSLPAAPGLPPGAVAVLDDLTPLMRAQKVAAWGEVARKLAHEIKNPLTPIQLSAQRVRKAFLKSSPEFEKILHESTTAIVEEVEALKNLVDEFAQFARLPAAHLVPASLHEVVDQALSLYDGLFAGVRIDRRLSPELPSLRLDAEQMKRAVINLVDNAIEATGRQGTVTVATEFDRGAARARLLVTDDGPGIRSADKDRLFVPHFSTKRRGSGLGLAIVSRIIQEHHGTIRVEENAPRGARFVVELPA